MVALAPNTSETSSWDVLDGFPKLHSRAREVKTRICTEAPCSKSLNCVEIWQAIYETCDGLESFGRDPIGYKGSPYDLYEFLGGRAKSAIDPSGESWESWGCCPGINVYVGRRCSLRCNTGMPAVLSGRVNELARIIANQLFDDPAKNAAMRHCIALGIIANESGCPCARCIGDAREYYQETCQRHI